MNASFRFCMGFCFVLLFQGVDAASAQKRTEVFKPQPENIRSGYIWKGGKGTPETLELAIHDLIASFGVEYPHGASYLKRLDKIKKQMTSSPAQGQKAFDVLFNEALLDNPLLANNSLLMIHRKEGVGKKNAWDKWGFPRSSKNNSAVPENVWDSEVVSLSPIVQEGKLTSIYKPDGKRLVDNLVLHWDADRYLFSMRDDQGYWQVYEAYLDGRSIRQITLPDPGVHNYDACYLPDGDILFCSTAIFQGVPCNKTIAGVIYKCSPDGTNRRQITFEEDNNHGPIVMANGRVMYIRWEYSDLAHYFTRLVFHMNPDGSNQLAYFGSNGYWPNCYWGTREIPGKSGQFIAVITGHHDAYRAGELVLFDAYKARQGAAGVVQRIPGRNVPVKDQVCDELTVLAMPQFATPYPLVTEDPRRKSMVNGKYFLVAGLMEKEGGYGIYLVDVFDNMVPVYVGAKDDGFFYPMLIKKEVTPPVIASRIDLSKKDATVLISDIYQGPGLAGVPRGTVKNLRLYSYHYGYDKASGHAIQGVESGWDVKRILGTVPVDKDGSAHFTIPANKPIAIQPLDEKGRAVQLMRSWTVGMPGERVSCIGCHESQNMAPPQVPAMAIKRAPSKIVPWQGPARPFVFRHDVQPLLDTYCISCHDGKVALPSLKDRGTSESYNALHPYIRRPGPESDYALFPPMEYHASTSELVQILEHGHYNVQLDAKAWECIYTWIDLNAQNKGYWFEKKTMKSGSDYERRMNMLRKYTNNAEDYEAEYYVLKEQYEKRPKPKPAIPKPIATPVVKTPTIKGWPFDADTAQMLAEKFGATRQRIAVGAAPPLEMVRIPSGQFVTEDKRVVSIKKAFWMSATEISNQQFAEFDPKHDSMYFDQQNKDHITRGYPANTPQQPVIRISSLRAEEFCNWLATKTDKQVVLPTEQQWEWACRAGTETPFYYGDDSADFGRFANLADVSIKNLAVRGIRASVIANPGPNTDFVPRIRTVDDGYLVTSDVGTYEPNAWGLHDMHGNVAEWTRSAYEDDGRITVKGGSWRDRPKFATAHWRLGYQPWQRIYNVGFRIVIED